MVHLPMSHSRQTSVNEKIAPPAASQTIPVFGGESPDNSNSSPSSITAAEPPAKEKRGNKHNLAFSFFGLLSVILAAVVIAFA